MTKFKVVRELKGGSFSSTKVVDLFESEKRVRKFISKTDQREYGLVRWQSQIRRMQHLNHVLPLNTPKIVSMGVTDSYFYYDIPYYESSQNLYEYLSGAGRLEAISIFDKVMGLMQQYNKHDYGLVTGSFSVFFAEEVIGRLSNIDSQLTHAADFGFISESECAYVRGRVNLMLPSIEKILLSTQDFKIKEALTHGNLTLENALFDHETDTVILIDPYSETYCESRLGDLSQLMQSSVSLYEEIVSGGEVGVEELFKISRSCKRTGVHYFGDILVDYVSGLSEQDRLLCRYFHAAQFIRMFPFKIEKTPRLAIYFLLHGLELLED